MKPVTAGHILYSSIYMKCPEEKTLWRQSKLLVALSQGWDGRGSRDGNECEDWEVIVIDNGISYG